MTLSWPAVAAIVALALLGGCATAPPAPPTVDVSGIWRGEAVFGGAYHVEWRLEQRGSAVTGNVTRAGPSVNLVGTVEGNTLSVSYQGEGTNAVLTVVGDEMNGSGTGRLGYRGTWILRRQGP